MVRLLDNEAVLLNLETEKYFGLDRTGTRMWQLVTAAPAMGEPLESVIVPLMAPVVSWPQAGATPPRSARIKAAHSNNPVAASFPFIFAR